MTVVPGDLMFRTTNLVVNFVKVGRDHALAIDARVIAQTKKMITVRAAFRRDDDELIAEASAQQLLVPFGR
jgi:acyl-coenzyme A thioesterase PaaI-like protein